MTVDELRKALESMPGDALVLTVSRGGLLYETTTHIRLASVTQIEPPDDNQFCDVPPGSGIAAIIIETLD